MQENQQDRLIPLSEVSRLLGISKTSVWAHVRSGLLPAPLKFGPRMSRWRLSDINAVIARAEEAGRDAAA